MLRSNCASMNVSVDRLVASWSLSFLFKIVTDLTTFFKLIVTVALYLHTTSGECTAGKRFLELRLVLYLLLLDYSLKATALRILDIDLNQSEYLANVSKSMLRRINLWYLFISTWLLVSFWKRLFIINGARNAICQTIVSTTYTKFLTFSSFIGLVYRLVLKTC